MRKSKRLGALALVAGLAITAAACGSDKKESSGTTATSTTATGATTTAASGGSASSTPSTGSLDGKGTIACEVTDTGGADDKGFNQNAYEGITSAEKAYGIEGALLESKTDADYAPNINQFIEKKCSVIVTVGFLLGSATAEAAKANPNVQFAIVDSDANDDNGTPDDTTDDVNLANVRALNFATEQPSYLAGYLAAGVSKSGIVATYGGIKIPPVTSFMNGFLQGVNKYNEVHGTSVKVLGWDGTDGSFTNNFESLDDGKKVTQGFIDEGADIVFPVAGPVGLGTSALAKETGKIRVIGVDVDQYESNPNEKEVYLTSVIKKISAAVDDTIRNIIETGKAGEDYVGTLANGGLDLAPFHDQAADVPQALQDEIAGLRQDIIDGKITVTP
ncbi:MAG: BMP family ABC transporter substrate-binding protein [Ilumatobacteraceae bacterium]